MKLNSMLDGIIIDGTISQFEIIELSNWIHHNKQVLKCSSFCEYADVILSSADSGLMDMDFVRSFSLLCKKYFSEHGLLSEEESLIELRFFCHGLLADGYISNAEMIGLKHWMEYNSHLRGLYPYGELMNIVRIAVLDIGNKEALRLKLTDLLFNICDLHSPRVVHHIQSLLHESKRIQNSK